MHRALLSVYLLALLQGLILLDKLNVFFSATGYTTKVILMQDLPALVAETAQHRVGMVIWHHLIW